MRRYLRQGPTEQQRSLQAACAAARIESITFHGLRHTYASRLAMNGVLLAVIAAQLGHSDTRMVEKHYGHLAPNYFADTVRAGFTALGIVETDNVVTHRAGGRGNLVTVRSKDLRPVPPSPTLALTILRVP